MVRLIAEAHGKKIIMTKLFDPILRLLNSGTINKVFGHLVYEKQMSFCGKSNYQTINFNDSIIYTEMEKLGQ